jgi:hypothetical protein
MRRRALVPCVLLASAGIGPLVRQKLGRVVCRQSKHVACVPSLVTALNGDTLTRAPLASGRACGQNECVLLSSRLLPTLVCGVLGALLLGTYGDSASMRFAGGTRDTVEPLV